MGTFPVDCDCGFCRAYDISVSLEFNRDGAVEGKYCTFGEENNDNDNENITFPSQNELHPKDIEVDRQGK